MAVKAYTILDGKPKMIQAAFVDYEYIYCFCTHKNKNCNEYLHMYNNITHTINNRFMIRESLCPDDGGQDVQIRVDPTTLRVSCSYYANKSIVLSKRKFRKQEREYNLNSSTHNFSIRKGKFRTSFSI